MLDIKAIKNNISVLNSTGATINAFTLINVYNDAGTLKMQPANAILSSGTVYPATHILLETALTTESKLCTNFQKLDSVSGLSGLTPGDLYLGSLGQITSTIPDGDYDIKQKIGFAKDATNALISILDNGIINKTLVNPFLFKGAINLNSDFPTPTEVRNGWVYIVQTNVTDNDPTKTNTGQSFLSGDEIVWEGSTWIELGSTTLWTRTGTTLSPATLNDNIDIGTGIITLAESDYNITLPNPGYAEGKVFYDNTKHALSYFNDEPDITVNLGQEVLIRVKNETGSTIPNGAVVYPSGFSGGDVLIDLAIASDKEKCRLIGVVTHEILSGDTGYVTKLGEVADVDTDSFTSGDVVYLSPSVAGGLTKTRPTGANYITRIGAVKIKSATVGSIVVDISTSEQTVESTQDVGFSRTDDCTISVSDSATGATLTLTPVGADYCFYQYGDKYCKTTDSIALPDEEGLFAIYYNLGTLAYIKNPTNSQIEIVIKNNPVVAYVYWNATDNKSEYIGYELHGINMSSVTHVYLHFAFGARYMSGLAPNTIVADGSGNSNASAQFGVDSGAIADEDLYLAFPGILSTTGLTIAYLSGTSANPTLRTTTNAGFSVLTTGTGRLAYNTISAGNYVLAEVTNKDFGLCHVIAINENNVSKRVIAFVGQNLYPDIGAARAGAQVEIATLRTVGILPQESKAIASFVFETQNAYTNAVKSRIRTISTGVNYVDWRTTYFNGSGSGASSGVGSTIFDDSLFKIIDNVDATKAVQFEVGGVTTGTTRVVAIPDANSTTITDEEQTIMGRKYFTPDIDSTTAYQFFKADGVTPLLTVDSTNELLLDKDDKELINKNRAIAYAIALG